MTSDKFPLGSSGARCRQAYAMDDNVVGHVAPWRDPRHFADGDLHG